MNGREGIFKRKKTSSKEEQEGEEIMESIEA
jgi:hypothetical protein